METAILCPWHEYNFFNHHIENEVFSYPPQGKLETRFPHNVDSVLMAIRFSQRKQMIEYSSNMIIAVIMQYIACHGMLYLRRKTMVGDL